MTTVTLPEHKTPPGEMLRNVLEALVPILLTCVIISLILFRVDVLHRFDQSAAATRATACQAVEELAVAHEQVWERVIAQNPAQTPEQKRAADHFMADLRATDAKISTRCLTSNGTDRPSK